MLTPLPPQSWDYDKVAHLLNRAGFGGTPAEIETAQEKGLSAVVRELVDVNADTEHFSPPSWAKPRDLREIRMEARMAESPEMRKEKLRAFRVIEGENILDLRRWWLERMMTTRMPLLEKMTLFWHGHFATSVQKARDAYWMWLQNDTLRRNALGNFVALAKKMSRDPAMMIYLDLQQSRREHPNENWARELMELFTLGIGNYSEQDVRESARAFTGYRIDFTSQQFRFAPFQHDDGPKTFMGKTGGFNGDDIIDILAKHPACAEFIGRKLWRFFVEDESPKEIVDAVANRIRAHNFEMRPVLREIFSAKEFYAEHVLRAQIKSPVQFLVQTSKLLETQLPPPFIAQNAMRQMGQILFAPPNVKGWDGGKAWISTSTLLFRYNFANYLINGDASLPRPDQNRLKGVDPAFRRAAAAAFAESRKAIDLSTIVPADLREKSPELIAHLSRRLFQKPFPEKEMQTFVQYLDTRKPDTSDATMRGLIHLMMSTPQFQLT
ncbi:MAG: hypothetical protein QOI04_2015 [Verrucomicrobiota bacterium]|jgi:uncharacterized protein (DUF1800 family)